MQELSSANDVIASICDVLTDHKTVAVGEIMAAAAIGFEAKRGRQASTWRPSSRKVDSLRRRTRHLARSSATSAQSSGSPYFS